MNRNDTNHKIGVVLQNITAELREVSPTPALEAEVLLSFVCSKNKEQIHAHPEDIISNYEYLKVQKLLRSRLNGMPIAYLVSSREFFGINLQVNTATLIARPETELLVEKALDFIESSDSRPMSILEIGTGSGAISIALAKNSTFQIEIDALDISQKALDMAKLNAKSHKLESINFISSDLRKYTPRKKYDLVIANLPYIPTIELPYLQKEVKFEPVEALDGGEDGLDYFRSIPKYLESIKPNGVCLLEIHSTLYQEYKKLWPQGWNQSLFKDLSGKPRVIKLSRARQ